MKHQFHRSIIFWSGLFVMSFVCWAWWDSLSMWSEATKGKWLLNHGLSGIELEYNEARTSPLATERGTHESWQHAWSRIPPADLVQGRGETYKEGEFAGSPDDLKTRHQYFLDYMKYHPPSDWILFIPHWLILLTVTILWLGLLIRRNVTIRKLQIFPRP